MHGVLRYCPTEICGKLALFCANVFSQELALFCKVVVCFGFRNSCFGFPAEGRQLALFFQPLGDLGVLWETEIGFVFSRESPKEHETMSNFLHFPSFFDTI
jgi:hypothetical protein